MGTGTSLGVPMIAHDAPVLDLRNPKNWRTRSGLHVVLGGTHIQVDASQEFRWQCLQFGVRQLDTFILTHGHADHLLGMDDLRRFCTIKGGAALEVHSTPEGLRRVREVFPYAVRDVPAQPFYAAFRLREMPPLMRLPGGTVQSFLLPHGDVQTLGLVFTEQKTGARAAYFTDCKDVPPEARAAARGADCVILDALQPMPHHAHMSVDEALAVAADLNAEQTWLTHLTFLLDHDTWTPRLPKGVGLAWDGQRIRL